MKTIIVIALALFISGCSMLEKRPATTMLLGQYTALKYIGEDAGKAQRVIETSNDIKKGLIGTVTVVSLEAMVRSQIKWDKIDYADQLVIEAILVEARGVIATKIGDGVLKPEDLVRIDHFFDQIIETSERRLNELRRAP